MRMQQARGRKTTLLDVAFKLTIAGFMLSPIVAPVLLGLLIGAVILIGILSH